MQYQPPHPASKAAIDRLFTGPSAQEKRRAIAKARRMRLARLATLSLPPCSV